MLHKLPSRHPAYPWIALAAVVVMLVRSALTAPQLSHALDEPLHVAAALGLYESHKHIGDITHPPLAWLVAGIPLKLAGVQIPELRNRTNALSFEQCGEVGRRVLFEQDRGYWTVLVVTRLTMLVFSAVAMLYLYKLGAWLASPLAAMLAVGFFSTDPTLLGHAALINNDAAAAAAFLASAYHGLRWIVTRQWSSAIIAGAVFGAAIATKFTMFMVIPPLLLIVLARSAHTALRLGGTWAERLRTAWRCRCPSVAQVGAFAAVAFLVLWGCYLFDVGTLDQQDFFHYTKKWDAIPQRIRQATIPMPTMVMGLAYQLIHAAKGHTAYLNGAISEQGRWYYFPEALALKEPLAMLAGLVLAAGVWVIGGCRRPWLMGAVLLPAAVWMTFAMRGNLNIGIRHLLPILPLMYLFICAVMVRTRLGLPTVAGLIVLAMIETVPLHPNYLGYFNLAAGGPERGSRFLLDSNLDWGQDVARAADWLASDPLAAGRSYTVWVNGYLIDPLLRQSKLDTASTSAYPPRGLLVVSQHLLHGMPQVMIEQPRLPDGATGDLSWLKNRPVVARIGTSIVVYDLEEPARVAWGE